MNALQWLKTTLVSPPQASRSSEAQDLVCIHQFIEQQARETPEHTAVLFEDQELTYRELNERANQLAHHLRKRGVGAESVVGLGLTRSANLIVGLLGIWKAGGAYVPLDKKFPRERLQYTVSDAQPLVILTEESLRNIWNDFAVELVFIDTDWKEIAGESKQDPKAITNGENIAQLLYTSGSTGRPKGVEILHRGLVNFMHWFKVEPGITSTDTVIATTVMTFDTSAVELFIPLTAGARIVMLEAMGTKSFFHCLEKYDATIIQGTPTILQWFDEVGWEGKKNLKIISGGEELKRDVAEKLIPRCGELWNIYGPTETTVWSTLTKVESGAGPVPIGHPVSNTQIYLLDADLQAVRPGEMGEICIGGVGVARGYRNRREDTEARFVKNPVGNDRIYRTGDLGRAMPSGGYEYCGRMDHQIKINGERIEPGEIEAAIKQFPRVRHALVIAREDVPGEKHLVGYMTLEPGATLESRDLRQFLQARLPGSYVPPQFVVLEEFPKLINGKIDRNSLPKPSVAPGKTAA